MFPGFDLSAAGMEVQRIRLNTIAGNLANLNTTGGVKGEPYRRRDVLVSAQPFSSLMDGLASVKVLGVVEDKRPFKKIYEPGHPGADKQGYLRLPNVNPVEEMVNMLSALRAYEANVTAFTSAKEMVLKTLEIGR